MTRTNRRWYKLVFVSGSGRRSYGSAEGQQSGGEGEGEWRTRLAGEGWGYVDISGQIPNKREMLARHVSQREWLRSHHGVDEYLDNMTAWAAGFGRECGVAHAEGFRQHLGHGYPHEPLLQKVLAQYVHVRDRP